MNNYIHNKERQLYPHANVFYSGACFGLKAIQPENIHNKLENVYKQSIPIKNTLPDNQPLIY